MLHLILASVRSRTTNSDIVAVLIATAFGLSGRTAFLTCQPEFGETLRTAVKDPLRQFFGKAP